MGGFLHLLMLMSFVAADRDLDALLALKGSFHNAATYLYNWKASSPSPCLWHGIHCEEDRVTHLNLSGHRFSGTLSTEIGNLSFLVYLNLSNNLLMGPIPVEIGKLRDLKVLDLHRNKFSGSIPNSIEKLKELSFLDLSYNNLAGPIPSRLPAESKISKGNPDLCTAQPCSDSTGAGKVLTTGTLVIMLSTLGFVSVLAIAGAIKWCRRPQQFSELKSQRNQPPCNDEVGHLLIYSLQQLKSATGEFSDTNLIGQGVHGVVYRGSFNSGPRVVAVKRLLTSNPKLDFEKELKILSKAKHKNVTSLLGYCCSPFNEKHIISEYFPSNLQSLFSEGHHRQRDFDWEKRKMVMLGVAKGICHLHSLNPQIVHGGLKPSNILISDDDFVPKVSDYGICALTHQQQEHRTTFAYKAPETNSGQTLTAKTDTYAFGVLLVQVLTGKLPWELLEISKEAGIALREWVITRCHEDEFVDNELKKPPIWEVKKMIELALKCTETLPALRPSMDEVVQFLVEELLIANKSSELDDLFIELIMDPVIPATTTAATASSSLRQMNCNGTDGTSSLLLTSRS